MPTNTEIIRKAMQYAEKGNMAAMGAQMTDDFTFSGATPQPMNKAQFIALMRTLTTAMPDWKFNITNVTETGDTVRMTSHIAGKNTGTFDYPAIGVYSVAPTGRNLALPPARMEAIIRNGRVAAFKVFSAPGGGLMGILEQLGIKVQTVAGARY